MWHSSVQGWRRIARHRGTFSETAIERSTETDGNGNYAHGWFRE